MAGLKFMQWISLILCVGFVFGSIFAHTDPIMGAIFLAAWMVMVNDEMSHGEKK